MDFGKLMQQAQEMQEQMQKAQEEMEHEVVEGTAGGGAVTVKASGTGKLIEIKITKEAVDPDDVETLEISFSRRQLGAAGGGGAGQVEAEDGRRWAHFGLGF
jgi:DNA-binding YbaB/EbfC family protein